MSRGSCPRVECCVLGSGIVSQCAQKVLGWQKPWPKLSHNLSNQTICLSRCCDMDRCKQQGRHLQTCLHSAQLLEHLLEVSVCPARCIGTSSAATSY